MVTQLTPKVNVPDTSGQVPGFGFIPELRRPQAPRTPLQEPVLQDLNTAGAFGAGIANVLGTVANIAIDVRKKRNRLADNETMMESVSEYRDEIRNIRKEESLIERADDTEYFDAVEKRGDALLSDILSKKKFRDPFNEQQFRVQAGRYLHETLNQVDGDLTKRVVARHNANLQTQFTESVRDIEEGLLDIDGAFNLYSQQVEAGLRDGAYGVDRATRLKADFARAARISNIMRDFRANPDTTIAALEAGAYKGNSVERVLDVVGQERQSLLDELRRKRDRGNSNITSQANKLKRSLLFSRAVSGNSIPEFDDIREDLARVNPELLNQIQGEEVINIDLHTARQEMLDIVPIDPETGKGGLPAMLDNIDALEKELSPPIEGGDVFGPEKQLASDTFANEAARARRLLQSDSPAFIDEIVQSNTDIFPELDGVDYTKLTMFEKAEFRENTMRMLGFKESQMSFLTKPEMDSFVNQLDATTDILNKNTLLEEFYSQLTPRRFYAQLDDLAERNFKFKDFVLFNMVDVPKEDKEEAIQMLRTQQSRPTDFDTAFKDEAVKSTKEAIESGIFQMYDDNYGRTFIGSRQVVREAWMGFLRDIAATEFDLNKTVDTKKIYNAFLGKFTQAAQVGTGIFVTAVPTKIIVFKSPEVLV